MTVAAGVGGMTDVAGAAGQREGEVIAMRVYRYRWMPIVPFVAVVVMLTGCRDLLTQGNFSQIYEHRSSHVEVARMIGEPDEKLGDQWLYLRPGKHLTAIVEFDADGLVARKQWIDADSAVWEDSADEPEIEADTRESTRVERRRD